MKILMIGIISITLVMGAAKLHAQTEFIDQIGMGSGYGFFEDKEYARGNFNLDCLLGVHIHNWNTAILVGISSGFFGDNVIGVLS